jgi:hypothetical protein
MWQIAFWGVWPAKLIFAASATSGSWGAPSHGWWGFDLPRETPIATSDATAIAAAKRSRNVMSGRVFMACLPLRSSVAGENAIPPLSHMPAPSGPTPRGDPESQCHGECRLQRHTTRARSSILISDQRCAASCVMTLRRYLSISGQLTAALWRWISSVSSASRARDRGQVSRRCQAGAKNTPKFAASDGDCAIGHQLELKKASKR